MAADELAHGTWLKILDVARHAPSPHNVQPWRVKLISADEAELFIDGQRTLPQEDLTGSFLLSAMGMFLEAIDLLSAAQGLRLEFGLHQAADWFAAKARGEHVAEPIPFAHLRLVANRGRLVEYSAETFLKRRTCRISLHARPVPGEASASLARLAERHGHCYKQVIAPEQIERILERNIDAVFHDLNAAGYHDEITSWFRFTDGAALKHRDGLDWRCMNVSRSEFWLSARLPRLLLFGPTRAPLRRRYRRQLGTIPALGLLSSKFFVAENAIESGRFLMRFWLEVTRLGLYLHPYGNLVTNAEAAAWLRREVDLEDIWLVFKIGYAEEPPQSYRRPLEDILIA
jgi:nitroreductase